LLERSGLRALFAGDVILHLDAASTDALGTYTAHMPPLYGGNARDYLASLRRLRKLPVPDLVLPGHPQMDRIPQSPRVDERRWLQLLDRGIDEMRRLLARFEEDGIGFLDGTPRELLPGLHYLGDIGESAVYALAAANGLVLVDAPGGPALTEFLDRRFEERGWKRKKPALVVLTSTDKAATSGLAGVIKSTGCMVAAPAAGLEALRRSCPRETKFLPERELEKSGWLDVQTLSIRGRGTPSVAYQVRWAGKTVLFSGRVSLKTGRAAMAELSRISRDPRASLADYLKSLDSLAMIRPALWLPAVPVHGQNARVYDDEWDRILDEHRGLVRLLHSPVK
jgi:glyoxylase-like metal-dependent hydrolase (beta-lactamase superfamily II)